MGLSNDLISQFVKVTNDKVDAPKNTTVYGTVVKENGTVYVQIDGSEGRLTPISPTTTDVEDGDRVSVSISNHTAVITGNLSSPSARTHTVQTIDRQVQSNTARITLFDTIIAEKVSAKELEAEKARIDELVAVDVEIRGTLTANSAKINELEVGKLSATEANIKYATVDSLTATNATITNLNAEFGTFKELSTGKLTAVEADIGTLRTEKIDASVANLTFATIGNLTATNANITNLSAEFGAFKELSTGKLTAVEASIDELDAKKLSTESADIKYANIDFTNIGTAAMQYFYAQSGLIKDVVVGDQTITGHLVGVTISGDLIEGNTIKAEKLVIKGSDGLYYQLNTDGMDIEAQQTDENSLNGSIIRAKSITASKISVTDLVAFGATIGGFHISDNSIYSGAKSSVGNTTRGIYLDNDGQIAFGDDNNFVRFYKDNTGKHRLEISADTLIFSSSGQSVQSAIDDVDSKTVALGTKLDTEVSSLKDEISTLLRIESSRGTVFKNDSVSTVLSAVIYHGSHRITDIDTLKSIMGESAYLQWSWLRLNEDSYGTISADDHRIGDGGFTFTLSPEDVDTKITFMCELIV